jgi:hypothetical protein
VVVGAAGAGARFRSRGCFFLLWPGACLRAAHAACPLWFAGWDPPFALERGTNGLGMESFRFHTRKQLTSALCCRSAPERLPGDAAPAAAAEGRYGGRKLTQQLPREEEMEAEAEAEAEARGGSTAAGTAADATHRCTC